MKTKTLFTIAGLFLFTISTFAQRSADNIFRKYQNDNGVMYMDLGGDFAQFLEKDGEEIKSTIEQVKLMVFSKGNNMDKSDIADLKSSLKKGDYELLIQANDKKGKVNLYVVDSGDYFTEIFGMVESGEYNVYARLYGKIYYDELAKLDMDMGGAGNFGQIFGN